MNLEDMSLEEKIFRAVLDYKSRGDVYVEVEKVILGCSANGSETEIVKKNLTTIELVEILKEYTRDEINEGVRRLTEKDFIKSRKISETTGTYFYEILETLCDLEEYLEDN